jgi:hypothetical protein
VAERLLGRDVVGGSEHATTLRQGNLGTAARDAEIGQLGAAVRIQQDVLRLDVAVHDAALVRGSERSRHFDRVGDGLVHRQAPGPVQTLLQRLAGDVLEHDKRRSRVLTDVDHGHDVRMAELCERSRLASKALQLVRLAGELASKYLDRHAPLEHRIEGDPDCGAGTAAKRPLEAIATCQGGLSGHWVVVGQRHLVAGGR